MQAALPGIRVTAVANLTCKTSEGTEFSHMVCDEGHVRRTPSALWRNTSWQSRCCKGLLSRDDTARPTSKPRLKGYWCNTVVMTQKLWKLGQMYSTSNLSVVSSTMSLCLGVARETERRQTNTQTALKGTPACNVLLQKRSHNKNTVSVVNAHYMPGALTAALLFPPADYSSVFRVKKPVMQAATFEIRHFFVWLSGTFGHASLPTGR